MEENDKEEKKVIIFDKYQNPAKNFGIIIKELERISKENSIPMSEIINNFIIDLKNYYTEGYEKKIEDMHFEADNPAIIKNFISYLNRVEKSYKKNENETIKNSLKEYEKQEIELKWNLIDTTINEAILDGKKGTKTEIIERTISEIEEGKFRYEIGKKEKKSILKRLNDKLSKVYNKQEREEKDTINFEIAMQQIEEIVERENSKGNIKNKGKYWMSIKDAISGDDKDNEFNINIDKEAKEKLLKVIDKRISSEKDKIYYNQVKAFTNDFQFLMQYPEIAKSMHRDENKKFTDKESYDRFCSLRSLLQKGYDEYNQINELLGNMNVDDTSKKILTARKSVMDEERIKKIKSYRER